MQREVQGRERILKGILTLALVVLMGLCVDRFAMVSHAQSQGKVTATSANIREEPSTSSRALGSAVQGKEITIISQVQGSDGKTWYQTFVDAETTGYIRSDLVEITDGSTPPTAVEPTTPGTGSSDPGAVEELNPVSATVKRDGVRIRSSATTSGDNIIDTVSNGLVVTVTGRTAKGSDNKVWYQVSFSDNGSEVKGFIREDFLTISGELTPYVPPAEPENPPAEPEPETPPEDTDPTPDKAYDTELIDGEWYLLDYEQNKKQSISELYTVLETTTKSYEDAKKKADSEKVVIIILIFLLVAAASGIAMLVFKIRDMSDDAYFNQVERETLRRRGEVRTKQNPQKVTHTVGAEKSASGKPSGARSAGGAQGQRPMASKPAGSPQGQRPGATRPAGGAQGQRPMASKPAGSPQGQRPMAAKPAGNPQGGKPADRMPGSAESRQGAQGQKPAQGKQSWQSKNFMSEDDDEFEFGFLNYDGTEEK